MKNAKLDYWLVETNRIELRTIISNMYFERAKEYIGETLGQSPRSAFPHSFPRVGETFTMLHHSPIGQPFFGGVESVVWLAFCSGSYLRQNGRQIPMPIGDSSRAFGYSDQTAVFDDDFGLPRSVKLYATNGPLVFEYQVSKTTNFFGRNFPLEFRLIQHGQPADGSANLHSKTELIGKVTSIKPGSAPLLPIEIREKLGTHSN